MCACRADQLAGLLDGEFEQFGDIIVALTLVTDERGCRSLVRAKPRDLFGSTILYRADLLTQTREVTVAGVLASADLLPILQIAPHRSRDHAFMLAGEHTTGKHPFVRTFQTGSQFRR